MADTALTPRALADAMKDWFTAPPAEQGEDYHGHAFDTACDECLMGLAAHLLRNSSLSVEAVAILEELASIGTMTNTGQPIRVLIERARAVGQDKPLSVSASEPDTPKES